MRRAVIVLGLVAASLGIAPAAFGACTGTQNTAKICVTPGGTLYEDCVYLPDDPNCRPVSVPGAIVECYGGPAISC